MYHNYYQYLLWHQARLWQALKSTVVAYIGELGDPDHSGNRIGEIEALQQCFDQKDTHNSEVYMWNLASERFNLIHEQ